MQCKGAPHMGKDVRKTWMHNTSHVPAAPTGQLLLPLLPPGIHMLLTTLQTSMRPMFMLGCLTTAVSVHVVYISCIVWLNMQPWHVA